MPVFFSPAFFRHSFFLEFLFFGKDLCTDFPFRFLRFFLSATMTGDDGGTSIHLRCFGYLEDHPRTCKWLPSLKLTFSHLKMDGWNTIVSFWGPAHFQVQAVSFGEGISIVDKFPKDRVVGPLPNGPYSWLINGSY